MENKSENLIKRPPIITVVGHIDHGKSTLLDYIRKTNIVESEAGGITQHIGAYEVIHKLPSGQEERITFLDTPGHEAFSKMRTRGAKIADAVILVVAADDGVNVQTKEALKTIQDSKTQFVVAINKIDKPNANVDKVKQELANEGIYLEGYGGNIPNVAISAKTGQGVSDLLDTVLLMTEMDSLKKDDSKNGTGVIIESNLDPKKGAIATLIVTNGTLKTGMYLVVDSLVSPIRMMTDSWKNNVKSVNASSPVLVTGFSRPPQIGSVFLSFDNKKDAEASAELNKEVEQKKKDQDDNQKAKLILPLVIKSDFLGTLEAVEKEIKKVETDEVKIRVLNTGVGNINENDMKIGSDRVNPIVIGFNVKIERAAVDLATKLGIDEPKAFNIIYKINEYLEEKIKNRMPKEQTETVIGKVQVLKTFSQEKDRQVIGGRVFEGLVSVAKQVKIYRQQKEIAKGEILSLQIGKTKTKEITTPEPFGAMIESKITIAPGDILEIIDIITK